MNTGNEHVQVTADASQALGNGLVWRKSEAVAAWKGDLLSTTGREHPMPYTLVLPAPSPGTTTVVPFEDRITLVRAENA